MALYDKASLVLIPSGTKEGTIFSQKPTNGDGDFTFSRSTSATRVGPSGYIEKETQNLILQSNTFDTTWINSNTTETGGQSGYDGSSDAWLLSKSAANGMIYQSLSSSGIQTISVYAKQGTKNWMQIYAVGSSNVRAYYDLANGVLGAYSLNTIDRKIESVGNGWYRCSVTFDSSLTIIRFYVSDGNNDDSGTSGNIYIQDAQLEQGLVARDYIETTTSAVYGGITDNIPRLDYTDSSCPSLLLEPQTSQILPHSEYFGAWDRTGTPLLQSGYLAPDGTNTAYKITKVGSDAVYEPASVIATTTRSIYARSVSGTGTAKLLSHYSNTNNTFTLTEQWQRFEVNSATGTGVDNFYAVDFRGSTTLNEIIIWGANATNDQTYATSYIPTYGGAAVTRNGEVCKATSVSSLIGQTEGVFYYEFINDDALGVFAVSNNGSNSRFLNYPSGSNYVFFAQSNSGTVLISTNYAKSNFVDGVNKIAIKYASGIYKAFLNGTEAVSASIATNDLTLNKVNINSANNDIISDKSSFNQVLIFPEVLSDAECIALTTL